MTRICREVQDRIEETRTETIERWEKFTRTVEETICEWLPWPLDDLCGVIVRVITEFVKIVINVVYTVVRIVTRIVCEVVATIANAGAFLAGLVLSIPIIGPIIRAIVRLVAEVVSQIAGIVDAIARFFGIRITKHLRICIIILEAENHQHVADPGDLTAAIEFAKTAFYDGAKVRLHVLGIHKVNSPAPRDTLDVNTDAGAVLDELFLPGSYFETAANGYCFDEAASRLLAIGSPVVVFVVRSVAGQATGCSLLTFTDYVTVERGTFKGRSADPTVMGHEIAHACTLIHFDNPNNLMFPTSTAGTLRGSRLTPIQSTLFRNSRHVTFL